MKLKNIFLTVSVAGILFSCVSEDIEPQPKRIEGEDVALNLSLKMPGVQTKAVGDATAPYEYATPDELEVSDVVVAVFRLDNNDVPGDFIGSISVANPERTTAKDDTLAYKVTNVPAKTGKVRVLVIANSTLDYSAMKTYAAYQAAIETTQFNATFDPKTLVKVGHVDVELTPTNYTTDILVPMVQLAAKVVLNISVEQDLSNTEKRYYFDFSEYSEKTIMDIIDGLIPAPPGFGLVEEKPNEYPNGIWYLDRHIPFHSNGCKIYVFNNIGTYVMEEDIWYYDVSGLVVENIETKSKVVLGDTQDPLDYHELIDLTLDNTSGNLNGEIAFYTYEKQYTTTKPLKVTASGNLKKGTVITKQQVSGKWHAFWNKNGSIHLPPDIIQPGWGSEGSLMISPDQEIDYDPIGDPEPGGTVYETLPDSKYELIINPNTDMPECNTDGVIHGNLYDVIGKISMTTQLINYNYSVKPWQTRRTDVEIKPIHYLQVRDLEMSMPNMTTIRTTYQSSTPVEITNLKTFVVGEGDPVQDATSKVTVNHTGVNNGDIVITGALPTNFVPRRITFTVINEKGLTQDVEVMQYPPLYITFEHSESTGSGQSGQTNYNFYKFTSLVADYSQFPDPDQFYESHTGSTPHYARNEPLGKSYAAAIRANAILGFPMMTGTGNTALTIDTPENNWLISPNFMLASQAGIIDSQSYTTHRVRCRDYTEIRRVNGQNVTLNDWRMPTLAEVYVIDILQNVEACVVKKILEGQHYWSARQSSTITFMDPRVNPNNGSDTSGAVRCVRDLK